MTRYEFKFSLHAIVQILDAPLLNDALREGVVKHVGMDLGGEHYLVQWFDAAMRRQQEWFRAEELAQPFIRRVEPMAEEIVRTAASN